MTTEMTVTRQQDGALARRPGNPADADVEPAAIAATADRQAVPVLTAAQARVEEVNAALAAAYEQASTLDLTEAEAARLMERFPDDAVEIRPHDGLLYLPHILIRRRLNEVFTPGKWSLIRRREWTQGNTIYGEYVLVIRGAFIGETIGGHEYVPTNPKVNYSDALESTAAEALRRIAAKLLSCGDQVWDPGYCRAFLRAWGEQYRDRDNKVKWRKLDAPRHAAGPAGRPADPEQDPTLINPEQWGQLRAALAANGTPPRELLDYLGVSRPGLIRVRELAGLLELAGKPRSQWPANADTARETPAPAAPPDKAATLAQIAELRSEARRAGLSDAEVRALLQPHGATDWHQLSEDRAGWMLEELRDLPTGREPGAEG